MIKDKIKFAALLGFFLVLIITFLVYLFEGPFRVILPFSMPFLMILLFRRKAKSAKKDGQG
jgi:hypothetical protein